MRESKQKYIFLLCFLLTLVLIFFNSFCATTHFTFFQSLIFIFSVQPFSTSLRVEHTWLMQCVLHHFQVYLCAVCLQQSLYRLRWSYGCKPKVSVMLWFLQSAFTMLGEICLLASWKILFVPRHRQPQHYNDCNQRQTFEKVLHNITNKKEYLHQTASHITHITKIFFFLLTEL